MIENLNFIELMLSYSIELKLHEYKNIKYPLISMKSFYNKMQNKDINFKHYILKSLSNEYLLNEVEKYLSNSSSNKQVIEKILPLADIDYEDEDKVFLNYIRNSDEISKYCMPFYNKEMQLIQNEEFTCIAKKVIESNEEYLSDLNDSLINWMIQLDYNVSKTIFLEDNDFFEFYYNIVLDYLSNDFIKLSELDEEEKHIYIIKNLKNINFINSVERYNNKYKLYINKEIYIDESLFKLKVYQIGYILSWLYHHLPKLKFELICNNKYLDISRLNSNMTSNMMVSISPKNHLKNEKIFFKKLENKKNNIMIFNYLKNME